MKRKIALLGFLVFPGLCVPCLPQDDSRLPVPSAAELKKAEELIRDIFREEYRNRTPSARKSLAEKLLKQIESTPPDPVTRFVLLREACDLSLEGEDVRSALEVLDRMIRDYSIDPFKEKVEVLEKAGAKAKSLQERKAIAESMGELANQALDEERPDLAKDLARRAEVLARKTKQLPLVAEARKRVKRVTEVVKELRGVLDARKKLEESPDDPPANQKVGMYLCLQKEKWEEGLKYLAKGGEDPMCKLAKLELSGPGDASAQAALADAWWDLGESQDTGFQVVIRKHAAEWYRKALPSLSGLTLLKAKKRLGNASSGTTSSGKPSGGNGPDLLPLINPSLDAVSGAWRIEDGVLVSGGAGHERMEIPYEPPGEYEFTMDFTYVRGNGTAFQILSARGRSFWWEMGGARNTVMAFANINGMGTPRNPTTQRRSLESGRKYRSTVKVTKNAVSAYLDGELVTEWKTDFSDMGIHPAVKLRNNKLIGLGSLRTVIQVHWIEVRELTGKGRILRRGK